MGLLESAEPAVPRFPKHRSIWSEEQLSNKHSLQVPESPFMHQTDMEHPQGARLWKEGS